MLGSIPRNFVLITIGIEIFIKDEHPLKAFTSVEVTEEKIDIFVC